MTVEIIPMVIAYLLYHSCVCVRTIMERAIEKNLVSAKVSAMPFFGSSA